MPQPKLIIRKPPPKPLVFGSTALATTPQPSSSSVAVPSTSGRKMSVNMPSFRPPPWTGDV